MLCAITIEDVDGNYHHHCHDCHHSLQILNLGLPYGRWVRLYAAVGKRARIIEGIVRVMFIQCHEKFSSH